MLGHNTAENSSQVRSSSTPLQFGLVVVVVLLETVVVELDTLVAVVLTHVSHKTGQFFSKVGVALRSDRVMPMIVSIQLYLV